MENQLATRAATKQIRLQHWRSVIQDRAESGLTVKEYCEQHNITKDSYYYWLRTVREATLHSMGPVFAELEAPEKDLQNGDFHPELEIEINRARIRINRDTPEQLLLQAIHVLKHAE